MSNLTKATAAIMAIAAVASALTYGPCQQTVAISFMVAIVLVRPIFMKILE